jgi:hypothetical protein
VRPPPIGRELERSLQPSKGTHDRQRRSLRQEETMNRKLGQLIKATLFALPFALPSVALAQSAGGGAAGTQDSAGSPTGTMDNTDKQNAGSLGDSSPSKSDPDRNPPAGTLGTSGSSSTSDRSVGGDINKSSDDAAKMNSDSTTTTKHKKTKKTVKHTTTSDDNESNR